MSGQNTSKKGFRILRGKSLFNPKKSTIILEDGQLFYSKKTKLLYIGDGTTELKDLKGTEIGLNLISGSGINSIQQEKTISSKDNQFTIGKYNDNKENTIFEVGYGEEDSPKNIFEVLKDGRAKSYGIPVDDEDIVNIAFINEYLTIDYDNELAFDVEEIVIATAASGSTSSILGQAILGQMILA